MKDQLILYHGTCDKGKESILSNGLNPLTCITNDLILAEYYAECASDESGEPPVILAMYASKNNLKVDYNAYQEPLSFYRNKFTTCDREWLEGIENGSIPYPENENDYITALEITWSVRCVDKIQVDKIWEEA